MKNLRLFNAAIARLFPALSVDRGGMQNLATSGSRILTHGGDQHRSHGR